MRTLPLVRRSALVGLAALVTAGVWFVPASEHAGATTTEAGTLVGEGGDGLTPIMTKMIKDDAAGLKPDFASYTGVVGVDQAIADFVGDGPGSFGADFVVTERPLTQAEAAKAAADGRSFAYVPIAASPVALMTLVPNSSYTGSTDILPAQFCQHIQLNLDQLDGLYGTATPPYTDWADTGRTTGTDPRVNCPGSPPTALDAKPIGRYANLDPSMENYALMSLLDSTAASKASFGAALTTAQSEGQSTTNDPTPSEHWPYSGSAIAGGDQTTLGKLIGLTRQNSVSPVASLITLGAIMPVESDWTGAPLGVTWDLPTAAVQNAASAYVSPSAAAAAAAEADSTVAATSDPTTNNLVTFNASTSDAAAYNNYLMLEGYLVVPTNGLPADKAKALAQLIRFAVGGTGQADITTLGAAPATKAMVTADLTVAQQLDNEAASAPSTTSTTTASTASAATPSATSSTTPTSGTSAGTATVAAATTGGTGSGTGGSSLASTGADPLPLLVLGATLVVCGEAARRLLRRRKARV